MNEIDRLTEQTFNFIFSGKLNESGFSDWWNNVTTTAKAMVSGDISREQLLKIIKIYINKVDKVAENMQEFANDPKNNTEQTRPISQAVNDKLEILKTLLTTLRTDTNPPDIQNLVSDVDFGKLGIETEIHNITRLQYGWTPTANRTTGKEAPIQNKTLAELLAMIASGQQSFRTLRATENDKSNRPQIADENGNINRNVVVQRQLYKKHLSKWTEAIEKIRSDFRDKLRELNYNAAAYTTPGAFNIEDVVNMFNSQLSIFCSVRTADAQTRDPSVTWRTRTTNPPN